MEKGLQGEEKLCIYCLQSKSQGFPAGQWALLKWRQQPSGAGTLPMQWTGLQLCKAAWSETDLFSLHSFCWLTKAVRTSLFLGSKMLKTLKYFYFLRRLLFHPSEGGCKANEISPFKSFQPFSINFGCVTTSLSCPVALSDLTSSPHELSEFCFHSLAVTS